MIPYGRQNISESDINAVVEVLRSDFLTQGPVVPRFEQSVADFCGAPHAIAVNSATSALHLACMALGLAPGDWLWTSPNTFVASANCARYCGASVDFVDIDPRTYNISIEALTEKLERAKKTNSLPKILVPVHFAGQSCDMRKIRELSSVYGFYIIEDASHAIGGRYLNKRIGDCAYSDICIFSFHPVKIITTGEGGIALTKDSGLAKKMMNLRSHGITRDETQMVHRSHGPWYYEQIMLGYNYRLTDIQAALGLSQLARVDDFVRLRHQYAKRYDLLLSSLPLKTPAQHPDCYSAFHLYVVCLDFEKITKTQKQVFQGMHEEGIGVNLHYIPVHLQPYYQRIGFKRGDFPVAERYYAQAMTIPLYPSMSLEQQDRVVKALTGNLS